MLDASHFRFLPYIAKLNSRREGSEVQDTQNPMITEIGQEFLNCSSIRHFKRSFFLIAFPVSCRQTNIHPGSAVTVR